MDGVESEGLPVYQNTDGQYLYFWGSLTDWLIGSDYTTSQSGVSSTSNQKVCPTDPLVNDWVVYYDSAWNQVDVSIRCVESNSLTNR